MKRLTTHRAKTNAQGKPFSQKHCDRDFNIDKADHIDKDRVERNDYWRNDSLGIETEGKSRLDFIKDCYKKLYGQMIIKQNEKALAQRKPQNCLTVEKMLDSSRYCLEGMIFYLGNKNDYADRETHLKVRDNIIEQHNKKFPQAPIICAETHCDEQGAYHTTFWNVWIAHDKEGDIVFKQGKALEEMGFKNNNNRNDNAKKTFTKEVREMCAEIAIAHGVKLELTPDKSRGGQALEDYQRDQAKKEYEQYKAMTPTQEDLEEIKKKMKYKKVAGNYILSEKDFEALVAGCAIREKIDALQEPLSKVQEDKIHNAIAERYSERYSNYAEKHNDIMEAQTELLKALQDYCDSKGLKQDFINFYEDRKRRQEQKVDFDFNIVQNRKIEIDDIEEEIVHHIGR